MIVAGSILACACSKPGSFEAGSWLAPECRKSNSNAKRFSTSDIEFGPTESSEACVSDENESVRVQDSIRFIPRKSGLNEIKFECDRKSASSFLEHHSGERIFLIAKGKLLGAIRSPEVTNGDWCTIGAPSEFSEALELCEIISEGMGLDKNGCIKPCEDNEKVCVMVKAP